MNDNNRNTILAVILSGLILIAWQYFYYVPQQRAAQQAQQAQQAQSELAKSAQQATPGSTPQTGAAPAPSANAPANNQPAAAPVSRETAIAATQRVQIDTPRVSGSIS